MALSALLKKCKNVTVSKLLVTEDIGAKGWAQLADAVLSVDNIRLVAIQSSREMMKTANKNDLKAIFTQKTLKMTQIVNLMMSYPHVFVDIF